jgi:hypothetical protein
LKLCVEISLDLISVPVFQLLFPSQAYEIDNFGWISAAVLCFSLGIDKDINGYPRLRLYDNEAYIDLKSFTKGQS